MEQNHPNDGKNNFQSQEVKYTTLDEQLRAQQHQRQVFRG